MNKIKIMTENHITKVFLDDKEIEGITFFNVEQGVGEIPNIHLIMTGDLSLELDGIVFNEKSNYEKTYKLEKEMNEMVNKLIDNIEFDFVFEDESKE
jgi:hypothetical protein